MQGDTKWSERLVLKQDVLEFRGKSTIVVLKKIEKLHL